MFLEGTRFFLERTRKFLEQTKIVLEGARFFSRRNENIPRTNENISRRNEVFFSKEREHFSYYISSRLHYNHHNWFMAFAGLPAWLWQLHIHHLRVSLRMVTENWRGWLGRTMVLGNFQCRGDLLLWHMVGQGPAVLAAGMGCVGCFYIYIFFISSFLSSFSNASSVGRRLDILKYCGLCRYNPAEVVSYYRRRAC